MCSSTKKNCSVLAFICNSITRVNRQWLSLHCGKTSERAERTYTDMGKAEPSCCEATVLTTASPCGQLCSHLREWLSILLFGFVFGLSSNNWQKPIYSHTHLNLYIHVDLDSLSFYCQTSGLSGVSALMLEMTNY